MKNHTKKRESIFDLTLSGLFLALMVLGSYIVIPTGIVPITFQLVFALLSGIILAPKYVILTQLTYIILGLVGLPIFAGGGSGFAYVLKPTFGYIVGFFISALFISIIIKHTKKINFIKILILSIIGIVIDYTIGTVYCVLIAKLYLASQASVNALIIGCIMPFLPKDLVLAIIQSILGVALIKEKRKYGFDKKQEIEGKNNEKICNNNGCNE